MRSYCRLKIALVGFFLIYLAIAMPGMFTSSKEIFPFYSWFFFAAVPSPGYHYEVVILKHGNDVFNPPIPYLTAANIAVYPQLITAYQFIQKMGRAHNSGKKEQAAEFDRVFKRDFLLGSNSYQLLKIYYDPIERWHGKPPVTDVLQTVGETTPQP